LIGLERENVVREASHILNDADYYRSMIADGNPYGDGHASARIIQAIRHYFRGEDRPADFAYEA
jgi:UDP-N-acetylglucosamine 2-epimerase (non-hydrolysing)